MDYNAMANRVTLMMERFGELVEFKIQVDGYRNKFTGGQQASEVSVWVRGITEEVSQFVVDYTNIKTGDKTILIPANMGIPLYGSEIRAGNQLHRVLSVSSEAPGGIPLYYKVKARSYALVEDSDALIVPLSELEVGSIVVDPNRLETPQWIVVAQNHYKAGLTTLMTWRCVTDSEPFKGSSGNWNISPWSETWVRRWLINNFRNGQSAKLIKNLQPFTVTTNGQRTVDTISIPSNHEVGFEKKPGTDNGKPLEYFTTEGTDREAANALRIGAFDNQNIAWWTREAGGVNADGSQATLNPNYGHGLRPMINLLGGIDTTYNSAGEYELKLQ
jgi:hypothetical protein